MVNALSDDLEVEVARGRQLYRQRFSRGKPQGRLEQLGEVQNRRGTTIRFHPDPQIFGKGAAFEPARLFRMARSKAYLFGGVEIRWTCDPSCSRTRTTTPAKAAFHFPGGLKDFLDGLARRRASRSTREIFAGKSEKQGGHGAVEWAVAWYGGDGFVNSYCNTIPTGEGGTHEAGLRNVLTRGLRAYAELVGNKRAVDRHRRRRDDLGRRHAVGVHPRAGIRRPDQGPAGDARGDAHRRDRDARRLRPLARRQSAGSRRSCSTG